MDFEKLFLRNGFGVEVKENYRKCYTKGVEVNENYRAFYTIGIEVNGNLSSSMLINGFFGMKVFYGSSALRASDPPKNFIPQKPFINNLEGKFPFSSKCFFMINIFSLVNSCFELS